MSDIDFEQDNEYPQIAIDDLIVTLKSEDEIDETVIYGLSGLTDDDLTEVQPVWQNLDETYRNLVLQTLVDVGESHYELDYETIAFMSLKSKNTRDRQIAIELLRDNESIMLMQQLIDLSIQDKSVLVRADAVRALARFVLRGEFGKLPDYRNDTLQKHIIAILDNTQESLEVRRYAVEALANSSHVLVPDIISDAWRSEEQSIRTSSVVAMGHSCDDRWHSQVLTALDSSDMDMRRAAAFAAGELQLEEAVEPLIALLNDDDQNVQFAVIQALGDIGSKEAIRILEQLLEVATEAEDGLMMDAAEEALGAASLMNGNFVVDFPPME